MQAADPVGDLLRPMAEHLGIVAAEVAFRALPEYDLRGVDVGYVSQQKWDATDDDDNLHGSPELVIEVQKCARRTVAFEYKGRNPRKSRPMPFERSTGVLGSGSEA